MSDKYEELFQAYKKEKSKKVAERMLMAYNVLSLDHEILQVSKMFHKARNTVKNCCKRFKERGIAGMYDAKRSGRPKKIENETLDKYLEDPSMGNDVSELVVKVKEGEGVKYTESGMRARLHSIGQSPKRPQPAFYKRENIEQVICWRVEMAEWVEELKKDRFDLYTPDQYLVHNDISQAKPLWSPVGTRIWRFKYPHRSMFYIFGGITLLGRRSFRNIGRYTAKNVLGVVKETHRELGQFGIVWDRASQHTACCVTDYMADHASDIRVQWFPTAWAELNPVEGYWSKLARHPVMNRVFETVDERVKAVMNVVGHMKVNLDMEQIMLRSPLIQKIPGDTKYYCVESVTEEPPSLTEIKRCKRFLV